MSILFPAGTPGATFTAGNGVTYTYDGTAGVWTAAGGGGGGSYLPLAGGTMTGAIVNAAGTAAAPSLTFSSSTSTGFFASAAGRIDGSFTGTNSIRFQDGLIRISAVTAVANANEAITLDGTGTQGSVTCRNGLGGAVSLACGSAFATLAANSTLSSMNISANGGANGQQISGTGTAWGTFSDERIKTKLEPITDGLNKVATLRAVTGELLVEEGVRHPFLIAQDVQKVLPEAVVVDVEDQDTLRLRYTEVIPLLVSALHDAKDEIDALKARLDAAGV